LRTSLPVISGQLLSSARWIVPVSSALSGQVRAAEEGQNRVRQFAKNVRMPDAANRKPDASRHHSLAEIEQAIIGHA